MFVLIGLIDQPISKSYSVGWDTNKVGGLPVWLAAPPESHARNPPCLECGCPQTLVTQLYCPLGNSAFHRCLYIFVCPKKCNTQTSGWRVFRSMRYDPTYETTCAGGKKIPEKTDMDSTSWGEGADDWGVDEVDDWGEGADVWGDEVDTDFGASGGSPVCHDISPQTPSGGDKMSNSKLPTTSPVSSDVQHLTDIFSAQINIGKNFNNAASSEEMEDMKPTATSSTNSVEGREETMLLADSGRLDEMARILNTKCEHQAHFTENPCLDQCVLKAFYLEVVEEFVEEEDVTDHVLSLIKDYEKSEGHTLSSLLQDSPKSGKNKSGPNETYEKSELKHGDRKFHKFMKRLQRCPQQCVRYSRGGDPLLISDLEREVIEPCPACGGQREFELQLLPAVLPWLQAEGAEKAVEIDFGTVLVFTCKNNCWDNTSDSSQLMEEVVILQGDPDRHLYR